MYLAEIRGKLSQENENREDILTSNVFSFFKYANRTEFLYPFIRSLGVEITPADAFAAEFLFWPKYADGTEPDLVLLIGDNYLLFEAKYLSGFGKETPIIKNQLRREIEGGCQEAGTLKKEFRIFALTSDYFEKSDFKKDIPDSYFHYFKWLNWQSIALFIFQVLERNQDLPPEIRLFAEDLYSLFLKKNLRGYEGTKVLNEVPKISQLEHALFFDASTASFRGDFIGFSQALEPEEMVPRLHGEVFFQAATAHFRGDFIGFNQALEPEEMVTILPEKIFFPVAAARNQGNTKRFIRSENMPVSRTNPSNIPFTNPSHRIIQLLEQNGKLVPLPEELFFKRRPHDS